MFFDSVGLFITCLLVAALPSKHGTQLKNAMNNPGLARALFPLQLAVVVLQKGLDLVGETE
jgi:hypothetical protein